MNRFLIALAAIVWFESQALAQPAKVDSLGSIIDQLLNSKPEDQNAATERLIRESGGRIEDLKTINRAIGEILQKHSDLRGTDRGKGHKAVAFFVKHQAYGHLSAALSFSDEGVWTSASVELMNATDPRALPEVLNALSRESAQLKIAYSAIEGGEVTSGHKRKISMLIRMVNNMAQKKYDVKTYDQESVHRIISEVREAKGK